VNFNDFLKPVVTNSQSMAAGHLCLKPLITIPSRSTALDPLDVVRKIGCNERKGKAMGRERGWEEKERKDSDNQR